MPQNTVARVSFVVPPVAMIAPTIVMPLIAFEPLISGVCNWLGTFAISSNPKNAASVNMNNSNIISILF